jgi:hypothetical protein
MALFPVGKLGDSEFKLADSNADPTGLGFDP